MFDIGVFYAIVAFVAMMVVMVIRNRLLSTEYKEFIDTPFLVLINFIIFFCLADGIWGLFMSRSLWISQLGYTISTYAFHLLAAFSAFVWAGYMVCYLKMSTKYRRVIKTIRGILITIQIVVLVSNIWTSSYFRINKDAYYESYGMRNTMFFVQFSYYILLISYCVIRMIVKKDRSKTLVSAIIYSCVPLAFGITQMLWPNGPMYSLGFMFTAVLIYSYNITAQRESFVSKYLKEENNKLNSLVYGLSGDFQEVYYVDLVTGKFEIYNSSEMKNVNDDEDRDFFTLEIGTFGRKVYKEDEEYVKQMISKETIIDELSRNTSFSFFYRVMVNDVPRYYISKVIKARFEGADNKIIIGVFDDDDRIRKEMEQNERLREANEAKSNFLFSMSHDIRTPMNAILGFAELSKKHIDDKEYLMQCLDKISMSGNHLLALINDVLDMARIETGKLTINLISESLVEKNKEIVSIINELAVAKSQKFNCEYINISNEYVMYDQLHVNQILMNVLTNAVKYTLPGGEIKYTIEQLEAKDDENASFCFKVKDTGIGMSKEFLEHIFDQFERENRDNVNPIEGTGLGMSIVKKLVELLGGRIEIKSEQNVGTEVSCYLTFKKSHPEESMSNEEFDIANVHFPEGTRILLVDDNELNREIAADLLDEMGLIVEQATDGLEAVDMVLKNAAYYYAVVLMDVQMPRMNGYDATRKIRGLDKEAIDKLPIIAMTANAFEEDKKDAFEAGMNAHLAKPINIDVLAKTLIKFIDRKQK